LLDGVIAFSSRVRVKEKTSVPHARLACIHLQTSSCYRPQFHSVTADRGSVKEKSRAMQIFFVVKDAAACARRSVSDNAEAARVGG
jgi:hypothetical protein